MDRILQTQVEEHTLAVFWLGQAGFAFKTHSGKIVMVDPYLSHSMKGVTYIHDEVVIPPDSTKVDYVFCTHDHIDHADIPTLQGITMANPKVRIYGPSSVVERLHAARIDSGRVGTLNRGQEVKLEGGITAKAVYAQHTGDSVGFIFDFNGILVYHTGDTEVGLESYIDRMAEVKDLKPDILLVCINTGYRNLGPEDAAKLTQWVQPQVVIPMHYDLIEENTIDPQAFVSALQQEDSEAKPVLMVYGGQYIYRQK